MIVLLAAGIGVSVLGLLAVGFGIPISDTSFGNALLIAGVVVFCTGLILIGMWLAARELMGAVRVGVGQAARAGTGPRPSAPPPLVVAAGSPPPRPHTDDPAAAGSPPPWADEVATRNKPRAAAPEIEPAELEPPPAPPPPPDRPARRNLLFATKRRDKEDTLVAVPTALEAEPKVSFENAWPNPSRANGAAERHEPVVPPPGGDETNGAQVEVPAASEAVIPPPEALPPGVTVLRSGNVDGMAYTLYSDGSIEAQFAGESPIRFASFAALKAHVEQQQRQ